MPTKRYSTEQIVSKLRQAEEELEPRPTDAGDVQEASGSASRPTIRGGPSVRQVDSQRGDLGKLLSPPRRRAGGGLGPPPAGRVGAAGMLSAGPGAVDPPASGAEAG